MLKRVEFTGIKALLDIKLDLEPLTVLVGPNGCGKSTVLDQIELLCGCTFPDTQSRNNSGMAGIYFQEHNPDLIETANVKAEKSWMGSTVEGASYQLRVGHRSLSNPWFERIQIKLQQAPHSPEISLPKKLQNDSLLAYNASLQDSFSWRVQRLALERRMILAPSPVDAPLNSFAPSGEGLATLLLHLAANSMESYAALQRDLSAVVPHFERLYVRQANAEELKFSNLKQGYVIDLSFRGSGRIPATMASEGTLFALALLTALHAPDMPRIILMDDIDHGLHLSAQYKMVEAIRKVMAVQPDLQVVCSSHSPIMLDCFKTEEVRVMALDKDGRSRLKPLNTHPEFKRWSRSMGTGELWANLGEDWVCDDG